MSSAVRRIVAEDGMCFMICLTQGCEMIVRAPRLGVGYGLRARIIVQLNLRNARGNRLIG